MDKVQQLPPRPLVWDCGSSLYDSFELRSFERQLDSAIVSRTLSMPHLSDHRSRPPPPPPLALPPHPPPNRPVSKKPSRFSRPFHKLLRSIFGSKQATCGPFFKVQEGSKDGFYVLYDKSSALSTIPEGPETGGLSPDLKSLTRRSESHRFAATSVGISCA
ncbi:uncharacterized protein LOC127813761 [Diospyros lotus]|uniref:uncharacterized protein LOC127813761 n=1 Tax=Diospyros lotus TaxID=55363 RepID=UPI00225B46E6|nr:uncharacterized protein LOC127813761 [Diospyros lotus]